MSEFRMPSLGADMEAGTLVEWLKRPGDALRRGDIIAVVETQKGAIEIEVFEDGVLGELLVEPGTKVPVGTPLAVIQAVGGPVAAKPAAAAPAAAPRPQTRKGPPAKAPPPAVPTPSPSAAKISPAARRAAAERGIDLSALAGRGSGPEGAVVLRDLESLAGAPPAAAPRGATAFETMRVAIGAAMSRSKREIPHYYLQHDIDVTPATEWLKTVNAERLPAERLLLAAVFLKTVAMAIARYPEMNGFYSEGRFTPSGAVHIGTAIAIRGGGLIAPAIHAVETLSLDEVMAALRDLTARARGNRLRSSELSDATITVTSLGERGVDGLFGIIYPPQVAIVGFGAPRLRPWVVEGRVEAREVMTASLAADHRVSDGHRGALFLAEIASLLGEPEAL